jgi:hypothetical protein
MYFNSKSIYVLKFSVGCTLSYPAATFGSVTFLLSYLSTTTKQGFHASAGNIFAITL